MHLEQALSETYAAIIVALTPLTTEELEQVIVAERRGTLDDCRKRRWYMRRTIAICAEEMVAERRGVQRIF